MPNLALLRQRAGPVLSAIQLRQLDHQIQQIGYLGSLAQSASDQNTENIRHVTRQVSEALDEVDRALLWCPSMTPAQQQELLGQVDLILANNRELLEAAHDRTMVQIRTASLPTPKQSAFDEFMEVVTLGNWQYIKQL